MKNKFILYTVVAALAFLAACMKDKRDLVLSITPPSNVSCTLKKLTVNIKWTKADSRTTGYLLDLSTTNDFKIIFKTATVADTATNYTFEGLDAQVTYYARIRALSGDYLTNSHFVVVSFVSNAVENIFRPFDTNDITETSATFKWINPLEGTVSSIVLTPDAGGTPITVALSSNDVIAKTKTVTGLTKSTAYTAVIYGGTDPKGKVKFATTGSKITINSNPTIYTSLQAAVDAAVSGDVINFSDGIFDFTGQIININKALTLQAAAGATAKPTIILKTIALSGNIADFKVIGLKIAATSTTADTDYEKHIFGGTYLTATTNLNFDNCDFSGAIAGLFFMQTVGAATAPSTIPGSATINLTINNCLMHDFGASGGDFIDLRSGTFNQISVTNSSIYTTGTPGGIRAFFRTDATATAASGNLVNIQSCTFNNICNGGAFMRIVAPGTTVTVSKCILTNKVSTTVNSVSGTGTTLKFNLNNVVGTTYTSISTSNTNVTALDPGYASASTGLFTVTNATVKAAGLGDPRWL